MIEVNALFTVQTVKDIAKGKRIGNYIIFPLIGLTLLASGIASLVRGVEGFELFGAILMLVGCPAFVFLAFYLSRKETKENITSFGVDKGEILMNYKFFDGRVLITRTANGKTDTETLHFKELYKVKRTKKFFLLFVSKDEMYYVPTDSFVRGTPEQLFKTFYDGKVILDY